MECNYCKKIFSNKSSLNNHQKTARYCLKIQNKESYESFSCKYCCKIFTTKDILLKHLQRCKYKELNEKEELKKLVIIEELQQELIKKDKELQYQKTTVKELQQELIEKDKENSLLKGQLIYCKGDHEFIKEIAKQPNINTINNLNITSVIDFNNLDKIKDIIQENFNIQYIIDGQKGLARFVTDKLLKDENGKLNYLCTDPSRQVFKFKDKLGEIKKDVEAKKLTNYIIDGGIKKKTTDIATDWYTEDNGNVDHNRFGIMLNSQQSMFNLDSDNNSFKKELASITTQ